MVSNCCTRGGKNMFCRLVTVFRPDLLTSLDGGDHGVVNPPRWLHRRVAPPKFAISQELSEVGIAFSLIDPLSRGIYRCEEAPLHCSVADKFSQRTPGRHLSLERFSITFTCKGGGSPSLFSRVQIQSVHDPKGWRHCDGKRFGVPAINT